MSRGGNALLQVFKRNNLQKFLQKKGDLITLNNSFVSVHGSNPGIENGSTMKVGIPLKDGLVNENNLGGEANVFYHGGETEIERDSLSLALSSVAVFPEIINKDEAAILLSRCQQSFKRKRYIKDHWDGVISYYRETEIQDSEWNNDNLECLEIIESVKDKIRFFFSEKSALLKNYNTHFEKKAKTIDFEFEDLKTPKIQFRPIHVIDLHPEGYIAPHVDSVRHGGKSVCGLSLLSSSVMRLNHSIPEEYSLLDEKERYDKEVKYNNTKGNHKIDLYLPPNSLYILSGPTRFEYTHEILRDKQSFFGGREVPRDRRISLIFRDIV